VVFSRWSFHEKPEVMILYPLTAAILVALAQGAYTRALICERPEDEAKLWKGYRNFLYLWAVILVVAALAGRHWEPLPTYF
jgi:hypothetical protein